MTPFEFRRRFTANLESDLRLVEHPGLRDELLEFVIYSAELLRRRGVSEADIAYLSVVGLPRQAAPFLDFEAHSDPDLDQIYSNNPQLLFPLGGNGSGDLVGIEFSTRAVIYSNHDSNNERVFINSSIEAFAESLCLYQEYMVTKNGDVFLDALMQLDPVAVAEDGMWRSELRAT